jgi:hypothetical protein
MRCILGGNDMTKEDVIEIGKFLVKFFKNRKDVIYFSVTEGTQDMNVEEVENMIKDMFKENFTKLWEIQVEKENKETNSS